MINIKRNNRIITLIIFSVIILLIICLSIILWFKTGEDASVGIFSLAVTLLGTIFIAVELKNGQNVTCSEMLINLNNYFHDSDRLMKIYERLEYQETNYNSCKELWDNVKDIEIAQYCTFFENLYLLYRNDIAAIEDLDDLFGYRFFSFVNNPYIQEKYILPTSSSYVQIFKLYEAWISYRRKSGDKNNLVRIPLYQYSFSDNYLKNRTYLYDKALHNNAIITSFIEKEEKFHIKRLSFESLSEVILLQDESTKDLMDKDIYFPLSRDEFLESFHVDRIFGIFSSEELVAVSVVVVNRDSARNLAKDFDILPAKTFTFDAVYVKPEYRGYGLQSKLIKIAIKEAEKENVSYILATVSPNNQHSMQNFLSAGFNIVKQTYKYGGKLRNLIKYEIGNEIV